MKIRGLLLATLVALAPLPVAAIGADAGAERSGLKVAASVYPVWLLARNVAAGVGEVAPRPVVPAALGCPHDYSLSRDDAEVLAGADVVVINGGGLDDFVAEAAKNINPDVKIIVASRGLGTPAWGEEEGAEDAHPADDNAEGEHAGEDGDEHADEEIGHGHRHAVNPHWFASPARYAVMAAHTASDLAVADPANAGAYAANGERYRAVLDELSERMERGISALPARRILVQHDSFAYFADDYGLVVIGALQPGGASEPSAATMVELAREIRERGVEAIIVEPQFDPKPAQALAEETGIRLVKLDPVASGPEDAPLNHYETTMENNLRLLETTLGGGERQ